MKILSEEASVHRLREIIESQDNHPVFQTICEGTVIPQKQMFLLLSKRSIPTLDQAGLKSLHEVMKKTITGGIRDTYAERLWSGDVVPVREHLSDLIYGESPFMDRYHRFRRHHPGFGPGNITCILSLLHPNRYMIVSRESDLGMKVLESEGVISFGNRKTFDEKDGSVYRTYVEFCLEILGQLHHNLSLESANLLTVHELFVFVKRTS